MQFCFKMRSKKIYCVIRKMLLMITKCRKMNRFSKQWQRQSRSHFKQGWKVQAFPEMMLQMNENFLTHLHIGWVTTQLLTWKKGQISPSSHWGSWEPFCKCQSLVVLKAHFSESSANIGSEQCAATYTILRAQWALWMVIKRKTID